MGQNSNYYRNISRYHAAYILTDDKKKANELIDIADKIMEIGFTFENDIVLIKN